MDKFIRKAFKAYFKGCFAMGLFILSLINFIGSGIIATTSMKDIGFFQAIGGMMVMTWIFTFSLHKLIFIINLIKDYKEL